MASTSVTTAGGVVVVTQVFPKEEDSMENPAPAAEKTTPPSPAAAPPPSPSKVDDMTVMFLRAEPKNLGVVQILIGLLFVLFSLTSVFSWKLVWYSGFSLAVAFVVSGSLAVAAGRRPSIAKIWACFLSHLLSALLALAGAVYLCWLMAVDQPSLVMCDPRDFQHFPEADDLVRRCGSNMRSLSRTLLGLLIFFLVLTVLQLCVAVTVCVYSGIAARLKGHYSVLQSEDRRSLLTTPPPAVDCPASP